MENWFELGIRPMLASLAAEPFDSSTHIYEVKWEGVRCLAFIKRGQVRLQSRRLVDITAQYPEMVDLWQSLNASSALLDGVLLVIENGRPSPMKSLQREYVTDPVQARHLAAVSPAVFVVFDVLYIDGQEIMSRPLLERKELLRTVVSQTSQLVLGTWVSEKGIALLNQVSRLGLSGVVAKEKQSAYTPGYRSPHWLKMQRFKMQDCVICGYTAGQGRREGLLGSLVLGVYHRGQLLHIGQVGSGYNHETLCHLYDLLSRRRTDVCPFRILPRIERPVTWVEPELICEVQYVEWTPDCKLRSPRFVRLRHNKRREDCQIEEVCRAREKGLEPIGARLLS